MGYDMMICTIKRKTIKDIIKELEVEELTNELFNEVFKYLYMYLYPEEYDIPAELEGMIIYQSRDYLLKGILDLPNDTSIMIEEESFSKLCEDIATKLRNTRLIDLVKLDENELNKAKDLISLYNALISTHFDWKNEVVVFDHSW